MVTGGFPGVARHTFVSRGCRPLMAMVRSEDRNRSCSCARMLQSESDAAQLNVEKNKN